MDKAIITGTFSECKFVKTRSVMQVVIECPIEQADVALSVLGGVPQPGREVHVAVARLETHAEPKERRGSLAQQAGILCGEPGFLKFLQDKLEFKYPLKDDFDACKWTRKICDVESRAEFDTDAAAGMRWKELKREYEAWKTL